MDSLDCDEFSTVLKYSVLNAIDHSVSTECEQSCSEKALAASTAAAKVSYLPADPSTISYGAISANLPGHTDNTFYLSTAIAYTNGLPHVGHAYEFLTADAIIRFHRVLGFDTYFLTGSDEHGQKVATSAEAMGRSPIEHCDTYVAAFQCLLQKLVVSNSSFVRTTSAAHKTSAQRLWKLCATADDIYLDVYEGWYNEREELFVTDSEAEAAQFLDPGSGLPLKRVQEESYFFRMSKYADWLINHIETNPEFIQPEQFRNSILARLRKDPLKDLSVSRTTFSWGIPVPEGFDQKHVMYVWFDALSNYISGLGLLEEPAGLNARYWPAQNHLIGKDIVWFHSVIWPCMLRSAGISIPKTVFCHGFVNAADGRKMSKSYNNTINPIEILDKYSADTVRYYSIMATTFGADLNFSEASLVLMHNAELADTLGNLVHRGINLCLKFCGGQIPDVLHDAAFPLPFDFLQLDRDIREDLSRCAIHSATFRAMEAVRATNRFLTSAEPWKMKSEADVPRRPAIVRTTLEAIYVFTHYLAAAIPLAADAIFSRLGTPPRPTCSLRGDFYNLTPGTPVTLGEILFSKIEESGPEEASSTGSAKKGPAREGGKAKGGEGKAVKEKVPKEKKSAQKTVEGTEETEQHDFTKIELRVGRIVRVWNHEKAERLFCEEIDVGEDVPRQIASGLRDHYSLEDMHNRKVIVVCNLKEAKLVGFSSNGMVLAAKCADGQVQLVAPPEDAVVGERVFIEGIPNVDAFSPSRVKKFKVWESLFSPQLRTDADCVATWGGLPLLTSAGRCYVESASNAPIS